MTTPRQLTQQGVLVDLATALEEDQLPQRCMYAFTSFLDWYDKELPAIRSDGYGGGKMDPVGQTDHLIERFLIGEPFDVERKSKNLRPREKGVWELKTPDLRFFGWFWRRDVFILYRAMTARWVKDKGAYSGLVEETAYRRSALKLDPPEFIQGGYADVFQV